MYVVQQFDTFTYRGTRCEGVTWLSNAVLSRTVSLTKVKLQALPPTTSTTPTNLRLAPPSIDSCHKLGPGSDSNMDVQIRQQARAQAGDSDPLEESRKLPPMSTRSSLNKKRAAPKPRQKPGSPQERHNLLLDLPPELRIIIYEYCVAAKDPVNMVDHWSVKKSQRPSLLSVNRQIREEVLPVFYKTNEFRFGTCHAKYITRWLFRAVRPQHLKLISAISWTSWRKGISSWPGPIGSTTT